MNAVNKHTSGSRPLIMMSQSTNLQHRIIGYWAMEAPAMELQAVSRYSHHLGFNRVEMSGVRCDASKMQALNAVRTTLLNTWGKN